MCVVKNRFDVHPTSPAIRQYSALTVKQSSHVTAEQNSCQSVLNLDKLMFVNTFFRAGSFAAASLRVDAVCELEQTKLVGRSSWNWTNSLRGWAWARPPVARAPGLQSEDARRGT